MTASQTALEALVDRLLEVAELLEVSTSPFERYWAGHLRRDAREIRRMSLKREGGA